LAAPAAAAPASGQPAPWSIQVRKVLISLRPSGPDLGGIRSSALAASTRRISPLSSARPGRMAFFPESPAATAP
jgi:hypothetical protein